jgi:hypothetical protein
VQHLGMGDRGAHVVRDQAGVKEVVLAGRVAEHPLVERLPLVPEACHRAPPTAARLARNTALAAESRSSA